MFSSRFSLKSQRRWVKCRSRFLPFFLFYPLRPVGNRNGFPYNCLSISRKWKKKFMAMYRVYTTVWGKFWSCRISETSSSRCAMKCSKFETSVHSNWLTTKPGTQQTLNTHFKFNFTSHSAVVSRKRLSKRWTTLMSRVSRWASRYFLFYENNILLVNPDRKNDHQMASSLVSFMSLILHAWTL